MLGSLRPGLMRGHASSRLVGTLTTKDGNHVFNKGTGARKGGWSDSRGKFHGDVLRRKYIQFSPDLLAGFELRAYVSRLTPRLASPPKPALALAQTAAVPRKSRRRRPKPESPDHKRALFTLLPDQTFVPWTAPAKPKPVRVAAPRPVASTLKRRALAQQQRKSATAAAGAAAATAETKGAAA